MKDLKENLQIHRPPKNNNHDGFYNTKKYQSYGGFCITELENVFHSLNKQNEIQSVALARTERLAWFDQKNVIPFDRWSSQIFGLEFLVHWKAPVQ